MDMMLGVLQSAGFFILDKGGGVVISKLLPLLPALKD